MVERQIFVGLLAAGAVVAVLSWGAKGYRERDQVRSWAQINCAAAQSDYAATQRNAGEACSKAIADLIAFKSESSQASAEILAGALADATNRNTKAADQARQAADAARLAAERMETADAAVQNDRVSRDWFDALNRAGGLREQPAR